MTYRLPPLNSLKAFEAAARNLSFRTAATELGVTAGAISQHVKKLENALSVELFRRLSRGLLLTEKGEKYYKRISVILVMLTEATDEIAPDHNGRKFSVGYSPEVFAALPSGWARSTDVLNNNIRYAVPDPDVGRVWSGELDCIIGYQSGPHKDLSTRVILDASDANDGQAIVFQSKPGLINCHQSDEIIQSVHELLNLN